VAAMGGRLGTVIRHGYCLVMREAGMGPSIPICRQGRSLVLAPSSTSSMSGVAAWSASACSPKAVMLRTRQAQRGSTAPRGLQVLLEHLGVALVVVQLGTLLGQALHRAGLEAAF